MHPVLGMILLWVVLLATFQAMFGWALPLVDLIDVGMQSAGARVGSHLPEGVLKYFLVDGLIAGTGSVPPSCLIVRCEAWAFPGKTIFKIFYQEN